jgi:hypothetical protein
MLQIFKKNGGETDFLVVLGLVNFEEGFLPYY